MSAAPLLSIEDICLRYGAVEVLHRVSLSIEAGEIVTILGPNGSGKSSLLRAALGILPIAAGTIRRAPDLRVGYVPQKLAIEPSMPITLRRFLSLPKRVSDAEAAAVLARVGLEGREHLPMAGLSGGQMQRALLARALLVRPQLLMLDEPTQGLDQPGEAAFYRLIEEVRRDTGCAVLMVSHDLHVVMAASDRVICLNGHICCEGSPQVVSSAPEYRALFGLGTQGALALYRHDHDHDHLEPHDHHCSHGHDHGNSHSHSHSHAHEHGHGAESHNRTEAASVSDGQGDTPKALDTDERAREGAHHG